VYFIDMKVAVVQLLLKFHISGVKTVVSQLIWKIIELPCSSSILNWGFELDPPGVTVVKFMEILLVEKYFLSHGLERYAFNSSEREPQWHNSGILLFCNLNAGR
jgi:hypothetical protein